MPCAADSRHTQPPPPPPSLLLLLLPLPPALKPDSSAGETPPTLSCYCRCQSPVCILHQPAARKIDQRSSPVGLTVRAVVCAGGVYAFPCARNHDTSAFELLFCCFRCTASICTRFILLHCDVCVKSDLIYCKCVMSSLKCP